MGMTITIDPRAGSAQLAPLLKQRGYPVELGRMEFGDASFMGVGPDGSPISISAEVKSLDDLTKCLTDGRFSGHQLPGLVMSYDQVWLLLIGVWRARADGILEYQQQRGKGMGYWRPLEIGRRMFMWRDLESFLLTLQLKGGIRVMRVDDYPTAAMFLGALYAWWTKGWSEHESHLQIHDSMRGELFDRALLTKPSLLRCVCAQLPNIGKEKSAAVASKFKTISNMVAASEADWVSIPGIGKTIARKVYLALRGGSNGTGNGH
jgi:ERCC4-type nuclease